MAESIINELLLEVSHGPPESDVKRQKLIEYVLTGNSKQYLGIEKLIWKSKLTNLVLKKWISS